MSVVSNGVSNVEAANEWMEKHVLFVSAVPLSHYNEWECMLHGGVMGQCADSIGSMSLESKYLIQHG